MKMRHMKERRRLVRLLAWVLLVANAVMLVLSLLQDVLSLPSNFANVFTIAAYLLGGSTVVLALTVVVLKREVSSDVEDGHDTKAPNDIPPAQLEP